MTSISIFPKNILAIWLTDKINAAWIMLITPKRGIY